MSKCYPPVQALDGIDFDLRRGEVHALVGENGAGKSTLAGIISGMVRADSGSMVMAGRDFSPKNKLHAENGGVQMVVQELSLIPTLTVAESIFFHDMPNRAGVIDYRKMNAEAARLMAEMGLTGIEPDWLVGSLGVGKQQMVEIVAALSRQCNVLILDEPTSALADAEAELLFARIRDMTADGVAVIYISHRMKEIQRLADRITVLRDGRVVVTVPAAQTDLDQVIRWMVGRDLAPVEQQARRERRGLAMRVDRLSRGPSVREVSFDLHRGEVLGFAGLMGSGRTETMRAIFAADRPESGAVFLGGSDEPAKIRSPRDAVRQGIALLTEDRKTQGLLLPQPVRVNVTLNRLDDLSGPGGWIRRGEESAAARRLADLLSIRCSSIEQPADELSGGNQQKVIMARWIHRDCDILIFDEPTRGIDVGAKFEIYKLLSDLAGRGKAVIIVSSDLKELLGVCDRIAVMSAGRLVRIFARDRFDQDEIMAEALSGHVADRSREVTI